MKDKFIKDNKKRLKYLAERIKFKKREYKYYQSIELFGILSNMDYDIKTLIEQYKYELKVRRLIKSCKENNE